MSRLVVTLEVRRESTRVLAMSGERDVLRAVLPFPSLAHPQAAETLLDAVSMWFQRPVSVVVRADAAGYSPALNLCDGFGFGRKTPRFDVDVYMPDQRHRSLGSFVELRRLARGGGR